LVFPDNINKGIGPAKEKEGNTVNTIDTDRMGINFIRQSQTPPDAVNNRKITDEVPSTRKSETQLADLLQLVNSVDSDSQLRQLKAAVQADAYVINYDDLVDNILASDHD
jgi:hypothetical protein